MEKRENPRPRRAIPQRSSVAKSDKKHRYEQRSAIENLLAQIHDFRRGPAWENILEEVCHFASRILDFNPIKNRF
jgi:hypothetical protein